MEGANFESPQKNYYSRRNKIMVKSFGKIVAIATTCALLVTPVSVSAASGDTSAEGSTTGNSQLEGIIDKDIFDVVLPTIPQDDSTFDFIIDPQGLIAATNNAAYQNAIFSDADKGVFFKNEGDNYSSTSNSLTAVNKGTCDVDVTLSAVADALKDDTAGYDIQLADSASFASSDTTISLYLALISGNDTAVLTEDGASISSSLTAAPTDAYEVKYNNGAYSYELTDVAQAADYTGFDSLDFNLTGACNMNADWTLAKDATPTVEVAWELDKHVDTPEFNGSTAIVINFKGDAPTAGSLAFTKPNGTTWTPAASVYPTSISINADAKAVTLSAAWLSMIETTFGTGTYSVNINGRDYAFIIPGPTPESDGTTSIAITYTGTDPTAGGLTFTKPNGTTWAPAASVYPASISISAANKTVTLASTWINTVKTSFGTGTYSVNINGTVYKFIVK